MAADVVLGAVGVQRDLGTDEYAQQLVLAAMQAGDGFVVTWADSVGERWYRINWAPSLTNTFTNIADFIEFPENSYTDAVHQADSQRRYQRQQPQ